MQSKSKMFTFFFIVSETSICVQINCKIRELKKYIYSGEFLNAILTILSDISIYGLLVYISVTICIRIKYGCRM